MRVMVSTPWQLTCHRATAGAREKVALQVSRVDESPGRCGPAALKAVLKFHGVEASERGLAGLAGTDAKGTTAQGMVQAARNFGFTAQVHDNATIQQLHHELERGRPCIVNWWSVDDGHYSVVERAGAAGVRMMDPETARAKTMDRATFDRNWFDFDRQNRLVRHRMITIKPPGEKTAGQVFSAGGQHYDVEKLWGMSKKLPTERLAVGDAKDYLSSKSWTGGMSPQEVLDTKDDSHGHMSRINKSNLRYPVVVAPNQGMIDGMHRLAKATKLGKDAVPMRRFGSWEEMAPALVKKAELAEDGEHKLQGHINFQGLDIAVENRKGSVRSGKKPDGGTWRTEMKAPYGYIEAPSKGKDGESIDAYVGPKKDAPVAFVVHQHKPDGTGFDEDKVMLGCDSEEEAKKLYLQHYDSPKFLGPISPVPVERLKQLVESGRHLHKISMVAMVEELGKQASAGRFLVPFSSTAKKMQLPEGPEQEAALAKAKVIEQQIAKQYGVNPFLTGSMATGLNVPGKYDYDYGINVTKSLPKYQQLVQRFEQSKEFKPSPFNRPGTDMNIYQGTVQGTPVDIALLYGEIGKQRRDATQRIHDELQADPERRLDLIKRKAAIKDVLPHVPFFGERMVKEKKKALDEEIGMPRSGRHLIPRPEHKVPVSKVAYALNAQQLQRLQRGNVFGHRTTSIEPLFRTGQLLSAAQAGQQGLLKTVELPGANRGQRVEVGTLRGPVALRSEVFMTKGILPPTADYGQYGVLFEKQKAAPSRYINTVPSEHLHEGAWRSKLTYVVPDSEYQKWQRRHPDAPIIRESQVPSDKKLPERAGILEMAGRVLTGPKLEQKKQMVKLNQVGDPYAAMKAWRDKLAGIEMPGGNMKVSPAGVPGVAAAGFKTPKMPTPGSPSPFGAVKSLLPKFKVPKVR